MCVCVCVCLCVSVFLLWGEGIRSADVRRQASVTDLVLLERVLHRGGTIVGRPDEVIRLITVYVCGSYYYNSDDDDGVSV